MINGNWQLAFETPIGKMEVFIDVETDGEVVTGVLNSKTNENIQIMDGKIEGNVFTFSVHIKTPLGVSTNANWILTVDGDTMSGTVITTFFGKFNVLGVKRYL